MLLRITSQRRQLFSSNIRMNDRFSSAINYYKKIINDKPTFLPGEEYKFSSTFDSDLNGSEKGKYHVSDALFELSEILESSYRNMTAMSEGFSYLIKAADIGHAGAQHKLAGVYATGIFGATLVPMDAGKALLLEYMAALGGSAEASMGMGYRHLYGIGVPESCENAKIFYEIAANIAADQIRKRGLPMHSERVKISDMEVTASGNRKDADAEVVDYYKHLVSAGGDTAAAHTLGSMYLHGSRFIEQDIDKAIYYLRMAADVGNVPASGQLGYLMAQQLALRVSMYKKQRSLRSAKSFHEDNSDGNRGDHTTDKATHDQSDELWQLNTEVQMIMRLLKYAANRNDAHGLVGLGYAYFMGLVNTGDSAMHNNISALEDESKDPSKEMRNISMSYSTFFKAQSKHSDAGFYMGEILMGRGQVNQLLPVLQTHSLDQKVSNEISSPDLSLPDDKQGKYVAEEMIYSSIVSIDPVAAVRAYAISSQRGNLLALHRLSHAAAAGVGMTRSCPTAVNGFKAVAERGDWAHDLTKAHRLYDAGDWRSALVLFLNLAAIGMESAQFNAAHLLMKADLPWLVQSTSTKPADKKEVEGDGKALKKDYIPVAATEDQHPAFVGTALLQGKQIWGISRSKPDLGASVVGGDTFDSTRSDTNFSTKANCESRALALYAVSAAQSCSESFLRVGDCFYYGCGGLSVDKVEAAIHYQLAGDLKNAHAIFNLGLMHEVGDGVQQDFHLAKRFYDQAAEVDVDAKLPRAFALFLLSSHKSLQLYLGAESTHKLVNKILETVRKVKSCYREGVHQLLKLLPQSRDPHYSAQKSVETTALRKIEYSAGDLRKLLESFVMSIAASAGNQSIVRTERKGLGDLIALLALGTSYLIIFKWRKSRRRLRRHHQHVD